jgi:hypothetical protein
MKKLFLTIITASLLVTACHTPKPAPHHCYATSGHYYLDGTIITADGNAWGFDTDAFCDDDTYVQVIFDDNGTPNNIYDDIILNVTELVTIQNN